MGSRKKRHKASRASGVGHGSRSTAPAEIGRRGTWRPTAAGRAVRDARIATAAHMRRAEVARDWEMTRVVSAMGVWRDHLRSQAGPNRSRQIEVAIQQCAEDLLLGGSGLSRPYPAGVAESAQALLNRRADDLDAATLYVVSPSMCDVVVAAAQTLTVDDLGLLDPDDLPSPTGLVLLPHPLIVRTTSGSLGDDRAYVWHTPAQLHRPEPAVATGLGQVVRRALGATVPGDRVPVMKMVDSVRITSYMDTSGPVRPDSFRDMAAKAAAARTPLPPLLADSTRTFPFHPPVTDATRDAMTSLSAAARLQGDRWRELNAELGFDEGDNIRDSSGFTYHPGDEINDADDLFSFRFLYAFWRLCGQQIAQISQDAPTPSAQQRADRAGVSSDVRVVTTRPSRRSESSEPASTDWQHRWVVRMHKVRQWYPSEQRHKIIYRGPYVKGPADKPLLGGEVVRSMS